ncbi:MULTISPECIES: redoxin family protein [Cyanophyceae]|uniref:redoxin family protein n=1 Tax=Cyanophyceae TaxID=3028117 RepID=UPI0016859F10|nr:MULTISPECIES: redoxin family protein [Cyanophyceae]MBD1918495.1 redoxin family protein [Phormidium sp. FACHB-77]MBD2031384.1 redoxin family protein [Phormidium sp. FACHB-322]MBD2049504.1 redoxin family protein [Leptolyngbya sp. FACHB-60]
MFFNYEGQHVPQVNFRMFAEVGGYELSTADLFDHKTVVAFAVPGAFTCPHSPIQLLAYNEYAKVFRTNGVDDIFCISVNDPFSLAAWAQAEGADQVRFIPDVTGEFTCQMGMLVNLSTKGMGYRSWRYSMLVKDGVIEKMFVEPDGFEAMPVVSNAATMLNYINPKARQPEQTAVLMQMWRTMLSA